MQIGTGFNFTSQLQALASSPIGQADQSQGFDSATDDADAAQSSTAQASWFAPQTGGLVAVGAINAATPINSPGKVAPFSAAEIAKNAAAAAQEKPVYYKNVLDGLLAMQTTQAAPES